MEVLDDNNGHLSNSEVLNILTEGKDAKKRKEPKNLATIRYETVSYLEDTPCKKQNSTIIGNFLKEINDKAFRLTKSEKLEILNQRPTNLIELQLLVEESEERFSEDAMNEILTLIEKTIPLETNTEETKLELKQDNIECEEN